MKSFQKFLSYVYILIFFLLCCIYTVCYSKNITKSDCDLPSTVKQLRWSFVSAPPQEPNSGKCLLDNYLNPKCNGNIYRKLPTDERDNFSLMLMGPGVQFVKDNLSLEQAKEIVKTKEFSDMAKKCWENSQH